VQLIKVGDFPLNQNWQNFLQNIGEWHGSFTRVSLEGDLLESTPSILNLDASEDNQLVTFRLRRFGAGDYSSPPTSDTQQEYRSLGNHAVFFSTGAFSKGSLQVAPYSEFGAEYGFVAPDRRLRFVQLYDRQNALSSLVLIREFRAGTDAQERSPLTMDQLLGTWQGTAHTLYPDWHWDSSSTQFELQDLGQGRYQQQSAFGATAVTSTGQLEGKQIVFTEGNATRSILLLADGTSCNAPRQLTLRQPFFVEVGWLVSDHERQRLIRRYNDKGEWVSATHVIEHRVA
jgi:hypothetical protein